MVYLILDLCLRFYLTLYLNLSVHLHIIRRRPSSCLYPLSLSPSTLYLQAFAGFSRRLCTVSPTREAGPGCVYAGCLQNLGIAFASVATVVPRSAPAGGLLAKQQHQREHGLVDGAVRHHLRLGRHVAVQHRSEDEPRRGGPRAARGAGGGRGQGLGGSAAPRRGAGGHERERWLGHGVRASGPPRLGADAREAPLHLGAPHVRVPVPGRLILPPRTPMPFPSVASSLPCLDVLRDSSGARLAARDLGTLPLMRGVAARPSDTGA